MRKSFVCKAITTGGVNVASKRLILCQDCADCPADQMGTRQELAAIVPRIYCTRGIGARQEEFVSVAAANHFENFLHFYVRGRISVEQTGFRDITAC